MENNCVSCLMLAPDHLFDCPKRIKLMESRIDEAVCLIMAAVTKDDGLDYADVPAWVLDRAHQIAVALENTAAE